MNLQCKECFIYLCQHVVFGFVFFFFQRCLSVYFLKTKHTHSRKHFSIKRKKNPVISATSHPQPQNKNQTNLDRNIQNLPGFAGPNKTNHKTWLKKKYKKMKLPTKIGVGEFKQNVRHLHWRPCLNNCNSQRCEDSTYLINVNFFFLHPVTRRKYNFVSEFSVSKYVC